jgi:peptidoglycan hydrolase-like protein with peptidoglycan-binding domain
LTAYALCPGSRVNKQDILERVAKARHPTDSISSTAEQRPNNISSSSVVDKFDPVIKLMQSELKILDPSSSFQIDGIFGSETRSALISFQQKYGLADDWEPGLQTRALLSTLVSHAN